MLSALPAPCSKLPSTTACLALLMCVVGASLAAGSGGILRTQSGYLHEYRSIEVKDGGVVYTDPTGRELRVGRDQLTEFSRALLYPKKEARTRTIEESFVIDSELYRNPGIRVHYRMAVDAQGKPIPQARNVVFYAPYLRERNFLKRGHLNEVHLHYLTAHLGYTVFSVDLKTDLSDVRDPQKSAALPEAGFLEQVFDIQREIESRHDLPHEKLLVWGDSFGGRMAQQLGANYPERVDAVTMNGGDTFALPDAPIPVAWLALNTMGDAERLKAARELANACQTHGIPFLHRETPPLWRLAGDGNFAHSANEDALALHREFLKAMVELRDQHGAIPPQSEWPVEHEGTRFPSQAFLKVWRSIPKQMEVAAGAPEGTMRVRKPALPPEEARGLVLFVHDHNLRWLGSLRMHLTYYARHDFEAVGIQTTNDHAGDLARVRRLLEWAQEQGHQNVYLAGSRMGGQHAMVAGFQEDAASLKGITPLNSDVEAAFAAYGSLNAPEDAQQEQFSPRIWREASDIPVRLFFVDGAGLPSSLAKKYAPYRGTRNDDFVEYLSGNESDWFGLLYGSIRTFYRWN